MGILHGGRPGSPAPEGRLLAQKERPPPPQEAPPGAWAGTGKKIIEANALRSNAPAAEVPALDGLPWFRAVLGMRGGRPILFGEGTCAVRGHASWIELHGEDCGFWTPEAVVRPAGPSCLAVSMALTLAPEGPDRWAPASMTVRNALFCLRTLAQALPNRNRLFGAGAERPPRPMQETPSGAWAGLTETRHEQPLR